MKKIVIALGGNAISREFEEGNIHEQFANTRRALVPVVQLIKQGHRICLTHGNGPQAGNMLIRVEESRHRVPPIPLGVIVADLQGGMGYMIQQTLQNKLHARGINKQVVALVTQMLVNRDDPSILNPTKFVGFFERTDRRAYRDTRLAGSRRCRPWLASRRAIAFADRISGA